jgi:hypothetical protein
MNNQAVLGVVNAAPHHFRRAVDDLARIDRAALDALLERRPLRRALDSILSPSPAPKLVHPLAE